MVSRLSKTGIGSLVFLALTPVILRVSNLSFTSKQLGNTNRLRGEHRRESSGNNSTSIKGGLAVPSSNSPENDAGDHHFNVNTPYSPHFYERLSDIESSNFEKNTQDESQPAVIRRYLSQACHRHPHWAGELREYCAYHTQWKPVRYEWWEDAALRLLAGGSRFEPMHDCMEHEVLEYMKTWPDCESPQNHNHKLCHVPETKVTTLYRHKRDGELVTVNSALSPQEGFAVRALGRCIRKNFPLREPFFDRRNFGLGNTESYLDSGNVATFLNGFIQLYAPGIDAQVVKVTTLAWEAMGWKERGLPDPRTLGIRTSDHLFYDTRSKLGLHVDNESVYTILIALSDQDAYEGGEFRLGGGTYKNKPEPLTAMIFESEQLHGVYPIISGKREAFVTELWAPKDVMLGVNRPSIADNKNQVMRHEGYVTDFWEERGMS